MTNAAEDPLVEGPRRRTQIRSNLAYGVPLVAVSAISLLLRLRVPVVPGFSTFDDLLYARIGTFLAHGQWLGPFDQLTLLKGPGYPAFIALTYRLHVPLMIGEQLTYLLAAAAVAGCVWVTTRRKTVSLLAYAVLALDPVNFTAESSRILRDSWYASLSMLFVATFFLAVYGAVTRVRRVWLVPTSILAGASGAAFWLTREEGVWIVPTILLVGLGLPFCLVIRWWFAKPRSHLDRSRVRRKVSRIALVWAVVGMSLIAPIVAVTVENSRHYGVALTNDLASGQFARAYADWRRVEAGPPSAIAPLVRSQRDAVYRVSAAARELEPYLEDPRNHWLRASCWILKERAPTCGDFAGSKIIFALRDAAASAGHFRSEAEAQRFFGELDAQIQAGCASGRLSCSPRLPTEVQSLQRFVAGAFFAYLRHWGGVTLTSSGFYDPPTTPSFWDPSSGLVFAGIVRDSPATQTAVNYQMGRFDAYIWPYRLLSIAYRLLLPCLLLTGLVGVSLAVARPRWPQVALSILSGAFLLGALSRLLFVALLATTLFAAEGSDLRYLLPAHAFLIAFGVVGTAQLADVLQNRAGLRHTGSNRRLR